MGNIPWNKGISCSKKTKLKISKAMIGKKNSLGKHHSEEAKKRIGKANSRERSGKWKGGIKKDSNGYKQFKVPKKCRFSSMKDKNGYIFVHRLVMAAHLQRPLKPEEVVHHINKMSPIIEWRI